MKRLIALCLAFMLLCSLTACGAQTKVTAQTQTAVKAGDIITIGSFEQDGDENNGAEPIEWIVLSVDEEEGMAILLSRYALINCYYHDEEVPFTWETSFLRSVMNEDLFPEMFTAEEMERILPATLTTADKVYDDGTVPGGNETEDYLFFLTDDEVEEFLPDAASRLCTPTAYALEGGTWEVTENMVSERPFAFTEDEIGYCSWWLRSRGATEQCMGMVYADGSIPEYGTFGLNYRVGVRPAMCIAL